jgi:hypothetical protein
MDNIFNFINTKLDITGDAVFNGLDLALWPFLIGIYWLIYVQGPIQGDHNKNN